LKDISKTGKKASARKKEDISLLEVVWYKTFNDKTKGIPTVEKDFTNFLDENGRLPNGM
jgi:hypothetical protein